ncbi:hypothetical protein Dimus_004291 [Dionaea muscipula]
MRPVAVGMLGGSAGWQDPKEKLIRGKEIARGSGWSSLAVMMDDEAVVMMQQGRPGAGGVVLAWRWSGEDRWWSTWCWWLAEARVGDDGVVDADEGGNGSRR